MNTANTNPLNSYLSAHNIQSHPTPSLLPQYLYPHTCTPNSHLLLHNHTNPPPEKRKEGRKSIQEACKEGWDEVYALEHNTGNLTSITDCVVQNNSKFSFTRFLPDESTHCRSADNCQELLLRGKQNLYLSEQVI